jgi:hypothetical protein
MSEYLLSPGVLARENDQSFIQGQPLERGAAIIGPTTKGPVNIPTIISSYGEFVQKFGGAVESGSSVYSYLTSIAANNYFQNGGTSLLVTRVVSGSFTAATSSLVPDVSGSGISPFVLETISKGKIMNNDGDEVEGALVSGSSDNIRWEITTSNTSSGTFSLIIRRGDDSAKRKSVLESYSNLSLDPYSPNYISKVIGDIDYTLQTNDGFYIQQTGSFPNASNYVRVKEVNSKTPKYFDNLGAAKSIFTGSLPIPSSGSFGGAIGSNIPATGAAGFYENITSNNIQGLRPVDYTSSIGLLSNVDEFKYNVISAPGLIKSLHSSVVTDLVNNTISRGDAISIIDLVPYGSQVNSVISQASSIDSSYAAVYWPWLQTIDPNTGEFVWVPASTMIPGVYAFTDASSDPWFAPAGITRGGLGQVIRAERKLTTGNRDSLYEANINPIATFPGSGVVVFGQKTLQKRASALDRVNVRRLLISLKSFIGQVADGLVFEQNTASTRNNFLTQVNPYLESVQQRQGLFAFKVVMDETNNTPDVVDRNELIGQIFLQPTRTAEYIVLDFNVTPTGTSFG